MSTENYVALRRSLREVNEDSPGPSLRRFFASSQKGWDEFVPARATADTKGAVVVVAPSGMGKTAELRAHADRLQSAGIPSFFMRALDLMSGHRPNRGQGRPGIRGVEGLSREGGVLRRRGR